MELIGTKKERNAPVAAVGEESFDDKTVYMNIMRTNAIKNEK